MMIKFASIPKCASRSLKEAGVLGEVDGRFHKPITEYPDHQNYEWHMVTRSADDWYKAWWDECRLQLEHTEQVMGMPSSLRGLQFANFKSDMWLLKSKYSIATLPCRLLVNAWIPVDDPVEKYGDALARGLDFKQFCIETICAGVKCIEVPIEALDDFLLEHGYEPKHENMSEAA
jgi:hypothetical protein